jgi:hypothetical protein
MPKIQELSTFRAKRTRMTGRIGVTAMIAAAAVVVAIALFTSPGNFWTVALGDASATAPLGAKASPPAPSTEPSRGFDYFPDHYVNQAKEAAELMATF